MTSPRKAATKKQTKRTAKVPAVKAPTTKKKTVKANTTATSRKPTPLKKTGDTMAENDKKSTATNEKTAASTAVAVRLVENAPITQPMLVNYSTATVTSGLVMVDLGFLEPAMMASLTRTAKAGGNLPKGIAGKLGARVVLTPEAARQLQQQLTRLLTPKDAKKQTIN